MPEPTLQDLLDRMTRIEEEIRRLKTEVFKGEQANKPWWEKIAGSHANDPVFAEIVRLGAEIRRADRPPDPPRKSKKTPANKKKAPRVKAGR